MKTIASTKTQKPVCLIVGRDHIAQRHLFRCLEDRVTFYESSSAECLQNILLMGADIVVVLAASSARQCAYSIQNSYPDIKIILESDRSRLEGPGDKNGFLSVINRSQSRSELVARLADGLSEVKTKYPTNQPLPQSSLDATAFISRLSSIPHAAGNLSRTAENLLELFLSAIKSGTGCLFLHNNGTAFYSLAASRNLPSRAQTMKIAASSPLARHFQQNSGPVLINERERSSLSLFAVELGCNLFLPLTAEGELQGWFGLRLPQTLHQGELDALSSVSFFAAESLSQSYKVELTSQQLMRERSFLTHTTAALAWIKPTGELEIAHDENHLISVRSSADISTYRHLLTSEVKEAVAVAKKGAVAKFSFRQAGTGKNIEGTAGPLNDGSVVLHLHRRPSDFETSEITRREWMFMFELLFKRTVDLSKGTQSEVAAFETTQTMLSHSGEEPLDLAETLRIFAEIFPDTVVLGAANDDTDREVEGHHALALLFLGLCARIWWKEESKTARLHVTRKISSTHLHLDLPLKFGTPHLTPELHLALEGANSIGLAARLLHSAFGSRLEAEISDKCQREHLPGQIRHQAIVSQDPIFVLQREPSDFMVGSDESSENRAVTAQDFPVATGRTGVTRRKTG